MTDETIVIHNRIPAELDNFIEEMAKKPEYHNKTHVVVYALQKLEEYHNDDGCYPPGLSYKDREEYNKQ